MNPEILLNLAKRCHPNAKVKKVLSSNGEEIIIRNTSENWETIFNPETNAAQAFEVQEVFKLAVGPDYTANKGHHWLCEDMENPVDSFGVCISAIAQTPQQAICNCAEKVIKG